MPLNSNVSQHKIDFYAIGEESGRTHPRRQKHKQLCLGLISTKVTQSLAFSFLIYFKIFLTNLSDAFE